VSDHTQSIPRVGGGPSSSQSQGPQTASGYVPKSSSPTTSAIPANGRPAGNARTTAPPAARTQPARTPPARTPAARTSASVAAPSQPWSPSQYPAGPAAATGTAAAPGRSVGQPATPADTGAKKAGSSQRTARGPRKARLQLRHVDTWSALKISLVLSVVMFFVWMVAVGILYGVLSGLSVFDEINKLWGQLGSEDGSTTELVTPGLIFGGAAVVGAINIVLFTALATISTYIYNLSADLVGGLEVTLTERE